MDDRTGPAGAPSVMALLRPEACRYGAIPPGMREIRASNGSVCTTMDTIDSGADSRGELITGLVTQEIPAHMLKHGTLYEEKPAQAA